jgi:hypothetical protein
LHRTNTQTLDQQAVNSLGMNDVGVVHLELTRPIFFDLYGENRTMGSFILIDPIRNTTLAAGMIRRSVAADATEPQRRPALVTFAATSPHVSILEHQLLASGAEAVRTSVTNEKTLRSLLALGLIVLVETPLPPAALSALAEFPILDAAGFSSTAELAALLLQPGKRVSHD